jgi:hypothetical protein
MNKHQRILKDIAHVHLPEYQDPRHLAVFDTRWRHYNVEHIVEDAMAHVGGYSYVDKDHYDNSDYSETKTGTCRQHDRTATISSIISRHTKTAKAGDIRAVIYNEFTGNLDYFFLPKAEWELLREHGEANCSILRTKYQPATDVYTKWQRFRLGDFETLARTPSTVTSPHDYALADTPRNTLFDWNPKAGLFGPDSE